MRLIRRAGLPCTCHVPDWHVGPVEPHHLSTVGCPRHDLTIDARTWAIQLALVK